MKLLSSISDFRRSWSLCSKWKNLSRTRGWGEVEKLYWGKGSHPFCHVREGKKKAWVFLVGCFYTTLNLEVGRQYIITWLFSPVG
jgi:hypothetical protein